MIHLIDELKVIPGVIGACIVNSQEGIKVTNLPSIFKPERLNLVGRHLLKLYSAGRISFADLTDVSLHFDESVVVARELEKGLLVFVVCDPTFNQNLLTMSFNLLHEEFKLGNFAADPVTALLNEDVAASVDATISGELQGLLDEMKGALGKVLGPMAGFVFDEVFENWIEQGIPDFSRIEELIEQIDQEIVDPDKIGHYRQLISSVLQSFQKG